MFFWILLAVFAMIGPREASGVGEETLYQAKTRRDPFISLVVTSMKQNSGALATVENIDQIRLEGIVTDPNPAKSAAVANGSLLKVGDEVGFVKVLEIRSNGVRFSVNGVEGFKALYREEGKK